MRKGQMYVNGKWVEGKESFKTFNPSTGEVFGSVYAGSIEDVDVAVAAARRAFPSWRALGSNQRAEIVGKVVDLLVERYGKQGEPTELKTLIMTEMGKRLPEADIEVIETSDMLAFFVKRGPELLEPRPLELNQELWPTKKSFVLFEPIGVVGVIKPWNYPLELPIWAIGPALVAGNTVVFKPSEHASFVGLEIARLFAEASLPAGVLNVITGEGETGKLLVQHDGVDMIAFTGSIPVGREIAIECAKRLRKYTLELGGNDAAVVEPDVDLELAANGLVWGAFCNSGQVCVRTKRAFVHMRVADHLTKLIVEKTRALRPGIDFGPIVSREQLEKVERQVKDAVRKGAKVLVGGRRAEVKNGFYFEPTVLSEVNTSMDLMKEECFGPVLPIVSVSDTEEAVRLANDTPYGLGGSVWTSDLKHGEELAQSLQAGMVWVNDVNVAFPEAPWGGIKQSGPGMELSEWGLYEYVHKKHVSVETSNETRRAWWYPYSEEPQQET